MWRRWKKKYVETVRKQFNLSDSKQDDETTKHIVDEQNKRLSFLYPNEVNYTTQSKLIYSKLLSLLKDEHFINFIHFIIDERIKQRCNENMEVYNDDIPKLIFKQSELKDNLDKIDELIEQQDSSNYSSSDEE